MTVSHGKPYAGKPHVRFDGGAGVPGKGRPALLHEEDEALSFTATIDNRSKVLDTSPLPPGVVCGEFLNKDGTKLLTVFHNASGKPATVKGVSYPPGNLSFNITSFPLVNTP